MPKTVNAEGIGAVTFPDDATDNDILQGLSDLAGPPPGTVTTIDRGVRDYTVPEAMRERDLRAVKEVTPVSAPSPFSPIAGASESVFMPGGGELTGPTFPRVGFTPRAGDAESFRGPFSGMLEAATGRPAPDITKGDIRKAGAVLANAAISTGETALNPATVPILTAAAVAPEVVIPIITAQMAKSGSTKLAEGIVDLQQGRDTEGVTKIGESVPELAFAAAPGLHPSAFVGRPAVELPLSLRAAAEEPAPTPAALERQPPTEPPPEPGAPTAPQPTAPIAGGPSAIQVSSAETQVRGVPSQSGLNEGAVPAQERATGVPPSEQGTGAPTGVRAGNEAQAQAEVPLAEAAPPVEETVAPTQIVGKVRGMSEDDIRSAIMQAVVEGGMIKGLKRGAEKEGHYVVVPPDKTVPGDEPMAMGPFESKQAAQEFLDSEVGAPGAKVVEVRRAAAAPAARAEESPAPKLFVRSGTELREVTPAQASLAMQRIRDESGRGASALGPMDLYDANGNKIGHVSYNGRVWLGDKMIAEAASAEKPAAPPVEPPKPAKEPWQMTRAEFVRVNKEVNARWQQTKQGPSKFGDFRDPKDYQAYMDAAREQAQPIPYEEAMHRSEIKAAIREGKPVPPEVLADYPDLAKPAAALAPEPEPAPSGTAAEPTTEPSPAATPAPAPELLINPGGPGYLNLRESEATPMALGRIRKADPARFAAIQRYFATSTPSAIAKAAAEKFNQLRAASETPAVPPPPPTEPPTTFGMAAGPGGGGRGRFGLDMGNLWEDIKALWQRRPIKRDMAQLADAMIDTIPANKGREAGTELRTMTQRRDNGRLTDNTMARKAVTFVIQAKGDPAKLATDLAKVAGNADAEAAIRYAQTHWDALQPLADRTRLLLDDQIGYERANGIDTEYESHYVPQRHENIITDRGILFGDSSAKPGSTGFKKAKVFPDYASAIEAGYLPRNLDIADLVEHRVRAGQRLVNRKLWADGFRTINDPYSGEPIMTDAIARRIPRPDGTVDTQYSAPSGYEMREIIPGVRVAVRGGYLSLFDALTGTSNLRKSAVFTGALRSAGWLKSQLLLLDSFHASRTIQTSLAARGSASYGKGLSLLEMSDRAITDAVNNNLITRDMADWIRTPQPFDVNGRTVQMTPRQVADLGQQNGLNVGRFADALYNEASGHVTGNRFSRWLFEKLTRGAMVETFLSEFTRVAKANPDLTAHGVARQVARDVNVLFGNLQRQSFIKRPEIRDLMQMAFLAPQWVESLARREGRTLLQAGGAVTGALTGEGAHLGTVAKTVGTGLAGYIALTQLLNAIFRGQSTLQNKEEGHKLDAFIPIGDGKGFWFSPLSVFGEVTHDMIRYSHTEPSELSALQRIAENKLGPVGRALKVFASGRDMQDTKLPNSWERVKESASQLVPLPIGVGPLYRAVGKELGAPTAEPRPGELARQAAGSLGFKIEPYKTEEQRVQRAREVNDYIEFWKSRARQLPIGKRAAYIESQMREQKFMPDERNKVKREIGESGVLKYK